MLAINQKTTGENIRSLRKQNKLTVEKLAEKLGLSEQSVYKWQRGESVPSIDNLVVLADMFGITIDEIIATERWGVNDMAGFVVLDMSQEDYDKEIRNKAIDEFAERLKTDYVNFDLYYILENNNFAFENTSLKSYQDMIDEIAEQMKGGAE